MDLYILVCFCRNAFKYHFCFIILCACVCVRVRYPWRIPAPILWPGALWPVHWGDEKGGVWPEVTTQCAQLVAELWGIHVLAHTHTQTQRKHIVNQMDGNVSPSLSFLFPSLRHCVWWGRLWGSAGMPTVPLDWPLCASKRPCLNSAWTKMSRCERSPSRVMVREHCNKKNCTQLLLLQTILPVWENVTPSVELWRGLPHPQSQNY